MSLTERMKGSGSARVDGKHGRASSVLRNVAAHEGRAMSAISHPLRQKGRLGAFLRHRAARRLASAFVVALFLPATVALCDDSADEQAGVVEQRKLELLNSYQPVPRDEQSIDDAEAGVSEPGEPADGAQIEAELDPKQAETAQTANGSLAFYGVGDFGLVVVVLSRTSDSCIGYVVDAPDEDHQDMVILEDLSKLSQGQHAIQAACTDLYKHFPAAGVRMSSRVWTSSSTDNWAYWVRRAAITGLSQGYSFEDIQTSIWFITDRRGDYASAPLLRSIGYGQNGPSKNVNPATRVNPSTNVNPVNQVEQNIANCGQGLLWFLPLTLLGLTGMKYRSYRQAR